MAAELDFGWCGVCCGCTDAGGMFSSWCGVDRWCGVCLGAATGIGAGFGAEFGVRARFGAVSKVDIGFVVVTGLGFVGVVDQRSRSFNAG